MSNNPFDSVLSSVQQAPQNQRTQTAIDGIVSQMQQSGNATGAQLGAELKEIEPRLLKAISGQQGG